MKLHDFAYDPFQTKSMKIIDDGENCLVTAHTGCGKTAIAEHAIWRMLKTPLKVVFTSPIKALSNEKFYDWQTKLELFGITAEELGLVTGDIKINPQGRLVIMTAEILNNMSLEEMETIGLVVMDEVHWINDLERGRVWENTLMKLPKSIQVVLLSATIDQPEKFTSWITKVRECRTHSIATSYRIVPLKHYVLDGDTMYLTYENKSFSHENFRNVSQSKFSPTHQLNKTVELLVREEKAPVIFFCMSRKNCERFANQVQITANTHTHRRKIEVKMFNLLKKYPEVRELPAYLRLVELFKKGVAYHHSGMIPLLKELVEILYKEGLIKVLFATETLAVGVNMPTRSVVFTELEKFTNRGRRSLTPAEFTQMSGRAGRRGHDTVGYVFYLPLNGAVFTSVEYHELLSGKVEPVRSQLQIDMPFVLANLDTPLSMKQSMSYSQNQDYLKYLKGQLEKLTTVEEFDNDIEQYIKLHQEANPPPISGFAVKPNKRIIKKMRTLARSIPDFEEKFKKVQIYLDRNKERVQIQADIDAYKHQYQRDWDNCLNALREYQFVVDNEATPLGKMALCFPDAMPLVMGTVVQMDEFSQLDFTEICMFLSLFVNPCSKPDASSWKHCGNYSSNLDAVFQKVVACVPEHIFNWEMVFYMQDWCENKNFNSIVEKIEQCRQGDFIKGVLRLCNFIDQVKNACLVKEDYDTHNRLDDHQERLMSGVVSNDSLYVRV